MAEPYEVSTRLLAASALLAAAGYRREHWTDVWEHIREWAVPQNIEEAADFYERLVELRSLIDDNFVIDADQDRVFEDPAFAEEQTFEDSAPVVVETQTKTTRAKKVTDGGS